jgi:hypothetical protein
MIEKYDRIIGAGIGMDLRIKNKSSNLKLATLVPNRALLYR